MGKHRTGPPTYIIRASNGGSTKLLNFYTTSYQSSHGREDFVPAKGKHHGTGYESNFRPEVDFSTRLENNKGVQLGVEQMTANITQCQPHNRICNGKEKLPSRIVYCESGFTMKDSKTRPNSKEVTQARLDTMTSKTYRPMLRRVTSKEVHHLDDGSVVPTTETDTCYKGEPCKRMNLRGKTVGSMELSGFTHYYPLDPILHLIRHPLDEESFGNNSRPMTTSAYRENFRKWPVLTGKESNARIRDKCHSKSGYTQITTSAQFTERTTEDSLPTINKETPQAATTYSRLSPHMIAKSKAQRCSSTASGCNPEPSLNQPPSVRVIVGRQELTGFSSNNRGLTNTFDETGLDSEGRKSGMNNTRKNTSIISQRADIPMCGNTRQSTGYTKGTVVHTFGDGLRYSPANSLPHLHSHAARVRKLAYPFYL